MDLVEVLSFLFMLSTMELGRVIHFSDLRRQLIYLNESFRNIQQKI